MALMVAFAACACSLSSTANPPVDTPISPTASEQSQPVQPGTTAPEASPTPLSTTASTTYADLTGDLYPNLPVYEGGSISSATLRFTTYTRVDTQEVVAFYRDDFTRAGWKLVRSDDQLTHRGELEMAFEKDSQSEKGGARSALLTISDTIPGLHTAEVQIGDFQTFAPNLPIQPDSTLVNYGGEIDYTTRASSDEVMAFYKSYNASLGWEFEGTHESRATKQGSRGFLLFSKKGSRIEIRIDAEDSDSDSNPVDVAVSIVDEDGQNINFTSEDFVETIGFMAPIEETIQVGSSPEQVSYQSRASADEIFIFYRNELQDADWMLSEEDSFFETIPTNGEGEMDLNLRFGRSGDQQVVSLRAGANNPPGTLFVHVVTHLGVDTFLVEEVAELTNLVFPEDANMKGFWEFTTESDLGDLTNLYQDAFPKEDGWQVYWFKPLLEQNQSLYLRQLYFQKDDQEIGVRFEPRPDGEGILVSTSKSYQLQFASGKADFPPGIKDFVPVDDPKVVEADENQVVYRTRLPFHDSLLANGDLLETEGWEIHKVEIFINPDKRDDPDARGLQERVNQLNADVRAIEWDLLDELAEHVNPEISPRPILLWVTLTLEKERHPFDLVLFVNLDDIRGGTMVSVRKVFR